MASLEIWKPISGYEGIYEVSSLGRIRSYRKGKWGLCDAPKIIYGQLGRHYRTVVLCKDDHKNSVYIHRLVAETFIPNLQNLPVVNHKDGNKLNNAADNLEWCTHTENMHHADIIGLKPYNRKKVVCVETEEIFNSITEAAKSSGVGRRSINNCVSGITKTAGKKHWRYVYEYLI